MWPTDLPEEVLAEGDCSDELTSQKWPYIVNCGYDLSKDMLTYLLTNVEDSEVTELAEKDLDWQNQGYLRKFDQKEFVDLKVWKFSGLAEFGYVFFPEQCIENDSCKLHVHLHGCGMGYENIFLNFIELSGLNDYAVTNDLIVLYPQANGAFPFNL